MPAPGSVTITSRAVDDSGNLETPGADASLSTSSPGDLSGDAHLE